MPITARINIKESYKNAGYFAISGVLAPPARLERTTSRLGGGPSIPVRYGGIFTLIRRQGDFWEALHLPLRRRMLYPLSYAGVCLYEAASIVPNFRRSVNAAQEIFRKVPQFRFSDCCNHRKLRI